MRKVISVFVLFIVSLTMIPLLDSISFASDYECFGPKHVNINLKNAKDLMKKGLKSEPTKSGLFVCETEEALFRPISCILLHRDVSEFMEGILMSGCSKLDPKIQYRILTINGPFRTPWVPDTYNTVKIKVEGTGQEKWTEIRLLALAHDWEILPDTTDKDGDQTHKRRTVLKKGKPDTQRLAKVDDNVSSDSGRVFRPAPPNKSITNKNNPQSLCDVHKLNLVGLKLGMKPEEATKDIQSIFPNTKINLEQKTDNDGSIKYEIYISTYNQELWVVFDNNKDLDLAEYVIKYKKGLDDSEIQRAIQDSVKKYGPYDDKCTQKSLYGDTSIGLLWGSKFKQVTTPNFTLKAPDFDFSPIFTITYSLEGSNNPSADFVLMNSGNSKEGK